jgi:hypothetical protein
VRHDQPELVDGRAEAARLRADAQIAVRGDLEAAAHADAFDHRHQRMAALLEGRQRAVHVRPVGARLLDVGALGLELGDIITGCEGLVTGPAHHDATGAVLGGQTGDRLPQALPHRPGERIQLLGAVEHYRGNAPITL